MSKTLFTSNFNENFISYALNRKDHFSILEFKTIDNLIYKIILKNLRLVDFHSKGVIILWFNTNKTNVVNYIIESEISSELKYYGDMTVLSNDHSFKLL